MNDRRKQQQRDAKARFRLRQRHHRQVYMIEIDEVGLDALQRWCGMTDAEIADPWKVREALTKMWAEAAKNDRR